MTPETQAFGQQMGLVAPKPTFVPAPVAPAPQPMQPAQAVAPLQPAPTQTAQPSANGLDPHIVTLAQSIRQVESGGDFTRPGKSGEYGAYQFMPSTWDATAPRYGVNVPLNQATPQQQNEVAYKQLQEWAQQHPDWNVGNFASAWNAGPGRPNAYLENNVGTNTQGVAYDTPGYARQVAETYQHLKAQNIAISPPPSPQGGFSPDATPAAPSFLGNLGADFAHRAQDLANTDAKYASGQQGVLSTVLQDAGHVAGGFGDVFAEALGAADRLLTGGQIGGALNSGVHALADTGAGQAIGKAVSDFSTAHPEAAANIGAIGNIAALFPAGKVGSLGVKGVEAGAAKLGATELAQSAGKSAGAKIATNLEDIFTNSSKSTVRDTFEHMLDRGQNPAKVLVERKLATQIPIEDGRVRIPDNSPVMTHLEAEVGSKSALLDSALSKVRTTLTTDQMKAQVDDVISQNRAFRQQGRVPEMQQRAAQIIDNYAKQEGKVRFRLTDIQGMKKGQTALSSMFRKAQDFGKADEHSSLGFAFQKMIEEHAPDVAVRNLNKQIGELISTQELLGKLDGATIRGGRLGRYGARILGATIGSQGSIPIISPILGAFMGDAIVSGLQKAKIAGPINRLLMKVAHVAPDNTVVKETQAFVEAVERGEKIMPSDDVAEFLAKLSAKSDIPLLPPAAHDAFKSVMNSGPTIPLPEKSLSTLDAEHLANGAVKTPQRLDGLSSTNDTTATASTIDKKVNIPPTLPNADKAATELSPLKKKLSDSPNMANGDAKLQSATTNKTGGAPLATTASKPSTVTNTPTGKGAIGRGDVSAQKAGTSAGFQGETFYRGEGGDNQFSGNAVLVKGKHFANSESFAKQYGETKAFTLKKGAKVLDVGTISGKTKAEIYGVMGDSFATMPYEIRARLIADGYDAVIYRGKLSTTGEPYTHVVELNDGALVPKSSPSLPKELAPLAAEARKYKSAEEMVGQEFRIPIDSVKPSQLSAKENVSAGSLSKNGANPIDVELKNGELVIADGNHRYFEALQRGDKTLRVRFPDYIKKIDRGELKALTDFFNRVKGTK